MRVLCFGDSNTWGYIPGTGDRYEPDVRWTGVLKQLTGFEVIEEGLNGRTTAFTDAVEPYRSGLDYIAPCVLSHLPLNCIVLMLGTNDTKTRYHVSANEIRRSMQEVIWRIRDFLGRKGSEAQILLVAPPFFRAQEEMEDFDTESEQKILRLEKEYEELALEMDCRFLKAGDYVTEMGDDGLHFTPEGHRNLAEAIAKELLLLKRSLRTAAKK